MGKNSTTRRPGKIRVLYRTDNPTDSVNLSAYFSESAPEIKLKIVNADSELLSESARGKGELDYDLIVLHYPLGWKTFVESYEKSGGELNLEVPLIVVAGQDDEGAAEQIYGAGASEVVIKSDHYLPRLRNAIKNTFERVKLSRELSSLKMKAAADANEVLDQHGTEDGVGEAERKLRELANTIPIPVFETDSDGRITFGNRACIETFGVSEEQVGKSVTPVDFAAPVDLRKARLSLANTLKGKELRPERFMARRKDGRVFPTLVSAAPIIINNRVSGVRGYLIDMSDLDAAQSAVLESEEKFRTLVESSVMGVYIIQDDRFAYVNPAMTRIFAYTQSEFLSLLSIHDVILPEDREKVRTNIRKKIEGEFESIKYDFRCVKKTGETIEVEAFGSRTVFWGRPAIIGTLENITQRREAEEKLRQSEDRYRTLFDETMDVIYISTSSGKMLDINAAGVKLFGVASKDEILNERDISTFYENPADRVRFKEYLATDGFVRDFETKLRRKDGQIINILDSATAVRNERGEIIAYRGILRDITERRRLEEQLLQSQKLESLGQLTSGIAHDFNNVLGGIIGFSELALGKIDESHPVHNYLKRIYSLAERAAKITKQLLAFARRQILTPKDLNFNELIHDLVELLLRPLGEHVEVKFLPGENLRIVHADPSQIEQVIMNLAVNAGDAMPEGGQLTIKTSNAYLDEYYSRAHPEVQPGNYVMVSVSDTGTGIDPAALPRIFEPFFTTKEIGKGTGLGLSVVHGIIRQHGGSVNVYSEVGEGTVFKLYFPALESVTRKASEETEIQQTLHVGTETVLIVEDNVDLREFMVDLLSGSGYTVIVASDGEEGMSAFKERPREISLIITDVMMPKMSGKEMRERIDSEFPGTKFLFISGYTESAVHHGFILDEHVDFLQKPFTAFEFSDRVRKILDR